MFKSPDLVAVAERALRDAGFVPTFPLAVEEAAQERVPLPTDLPDLRHLLWSSVDNAESRDLDQIEVAERLPDGDILLRVGIAEVDWRVPQGGVIDQHAAQNTSSLYTPGHVFPMLPEALSTATTSLLADQDRVAMVVSLRVNPDGTLQERSAAPALVRNYAKLAYERIGPWLEGNAEVPDEVAAVPGLEEQLRLQDETLDRFLALREKQGALNFESVETQPITENGKVVGMKTVHKNRARLLIESFMVAVNTAVAEILHESGRASIQRIVRAPRRWDRIVEVAKTVNEALPELPDPRALSAFLERRRAADPEKFPELSLTIVKLLGPGEYALVKAGLQSEGHFGLAVGGYTHSTAPNRRYVDIVVQRLIKSVLHSTPAPYTPDQLEALAAHCTERASMADKVERRLRKTAAALFLQPRLGEIFDATITGVKNGKVYARLLDPPIEGRVTRNEHGVDVGDRVSVKLIKADPETGFIDFLRRD
ncbi:RNB domain-containing ribonuclease [Armatimonas rosea]|uniref:Exoribonuclease-2 n=1 Tax=Armatimonas rosea TaxID=685828 RepID=A0A7W9SV89_ARMRO|nr:RNB domain-containing ribonuclease [Armatimonas rosea]MBB6052975.1 exoribonuclease-2 [Armatimonas rosea]